MEIPAWFESLFEKVVVVFELPASESLQAAGSTTLLPWLETVLAEAPLLVEHVHAGRFPSRFLTNVLGFGQGFAEKLPGLLTLFVILYLLCGGLTVMLRLKRKQTSLLTFSRQVFNALLIWAAFLVIPMRKALVAGGAGGEFYAKIALLLGILAVVIPLCSVVRYLWIYRLTGIPHAIFDVGFGLFAAAVMLLSAKIGILRILILLAIAALTVVQWEEPEYEDVPAPAKPTPQKAPAPQSAAAAPQKAAAIPQRTPAVPQKTAAVSHQAPAAPQKTTAAPEKRPAASQMDFSALLDKAKELLKRAAATVKAAAIALFGKAVIACERLSTDIRLAKMRRTGSSGKTSAPAKPAPEKPAPQSAAPAKPAAPQQAAAPAKPAEAYPTMALDIDQIIAEVESATEDTVL